MRHAPWLVATIISVFLLCGAARAEQINFKADLSGASEVPPVTSAGKGAATAALDTASKTLSWTVTYSGLAPTAGHIHGPAAAGANAGVLVPFSGPNLASPIKGSATLTDAQISDLEAGRTYINLHTADNKGGEIRGQLVRTP
jgi:hypothetical protein